MLIFLTVITDEVKRYKLQEIYNLYKKDLFYTAYKILGDYYEAEDVVQTTIIKTADYLDKILDITVIKQGPSLLLYVGT